ncbi:hypothetical protein LLEC1_06438 [Akanthomyces lecanii]|uniref:FHA domain-containing protein n=1 Tax=Cordyceps confragosa TaxID=2714763 RepID=A0A179I479_CORDF|nr:hypothetical protein LLEC1_06438 [Akanthomyces lecanii]
MWLLENEEAFEGRRLWLRPGKTYLFGRTVAEAGQLAISHNTISRKHLTITIDAVGDGDALHPSRRSKITIEDLATKIGTVVNGKKLKGTRCVVENGQDVEMIMGKCPNKFRLTWAPVAFTFSFSGKEMQAKPIDALRTRFEQLDIKLLVDYNIDFTTHVVAKKRNTAKGLQALINGKFIVTESFLDAVTQAAAPIDDGNGSQTCALEQHFDESWPDPAKHLPPRGGEPFEHPDQIYTPDRSRIDVFDGYTFIFYDSTQYNNLLAPITNGGGKALIETVTPGETLSDDFVRYVKGVAGEKGLGSFDDGSEGKGAVVVRYLPTKGDHVQWYTDFITAVSLRLDHRPIEQNEFLEAILTKDASMLRRPLQIEEQSGTSVIPSQPQPSEDSSAVEPGPTTRRPRMRKPVKRRFMGFDDGSDFEMNEAEPPTDEVTRPVEAVEEGGLFVSQEPDQAPHDHSNMTQKRGAPEEDDLMEGMAPAVARFKRQRIAMGSDFASETPEVPAAEPVKPVKKEKKELNILAEAARHRQEQEARARAEKEDLAQLPDDVDLAEIRRLNIVEEAELRKPGDGTRTRDQDIADGRWDPKWNGIKNFKKFRRRGELVGRQPARTIIAVDEVQSKKFGVGDNYWLEDETVPRTNSGSRLQQSAPRDESPRPISQISSGLDRNARQTGENPADGNDDSDAADPEENDDDSQPPRGSYGKRTGIRGTASSRGSRSQSSAQTSQSLGKRPATSTLSGQSSKRQRPPPQPIQVNDSEDDSDEELKFRFGMRPRA